MKLSHLLIALPLLAVYAVLPFLVAAPAVVTAEALDCRLDASGSHPCLLLGVDIGSLLNSVAFIALLGMFTVPTAGVAFAVVLILIVVEISRRVMASGKKAESD